MASRNSSTEIVGEFWGKMVKSKLTSDELLYSVQEFLMRRFSADPVVVYATPAGYSLEKVKEVNLVSVSSDGRKESVVIKRKYSREEIAVKMAKEFMKMLESQEATVIKGKDEIIYSLFDDDDKYIGFVTMYREQNFTDEERKTIEILLPHIKLIVKFAGCFMAVEDFRKFGFYIITAEIAKKYNFTSLEHIVLQALLVGVDIKQIAVVLKRSESAVKRTITSIYRKVGVRRRGELLAVFFDVKDSVEFINKLYFNELR